MTESPLGEIAADPLVGQLFEGRYEILSVLGQGGMGTVYKARHVHMDKLLAIKTLVQGAVKDENSFRRFEQEAKAAASLSHPNTISVTDFGRSQQGFAFLVMEFLSGQTLEDVLIGSDDPLSPSRFERIFTQVCDGMQHAHKKGIIHRDLKPSNLMLIRNEDEVDHVKIVDFGLAKLSSSDTQNLTHTGMVLGSPPFMSPEQCRGDELDNRSDIYSLGCVMYAALAGQVPLKGSNSMATIFKHVSDTPQSLSQVVPHLRIPAELDQLVMSTLEKDPAARPQSMAELSNGIRKSLQGIGAGKAVKAVVQAPLAQTPTDARSSLAQPPVAGSPPQFGAPGVAQVGQPLSASPAGSPQLGAAGGAAPQVVAPRSAEPLVGTPQLEAPPVGAARVGSPQGNLPKDGTAPINKAQLQTAPPVVPAQASSPASSSPSPSEFAKKKDVGSPPINRNLRSVAPSESSGASPMMSPASKIGLGVLGVIVGAAACLAAFIPHSSSPGKPVVNSTGAQNPAITTTTTAITPAAMSTSVSSSNPGASNPASGIPNSGSAASSSAIVAPATEHPAAKNAEVSATSSALGPDKIKTEAKHQSHPKEVGGDTHKVAVLPASHKESAAKPGETKEKKPTHSPGQKAEALRKAAEIKEQAMDAFKARDFSQSTALYKKAFDQQKIAYAPLDPHLMPILARIIDASAKAATPDDEYVSEALQICNKDLKKTIEVVNKLDNASSVWRPIGAACFKLGEKTQGKDSARYFEWAFTFFSEAYNSWADRPRNQDYIRMLRLFVNAANATNQSQRAQQIQAEIFKLTQEPADRPFAQENGRNNGGKGNRHHWRRFQQQ